MPCSSQESSSFCLTGREESETWVSFAQKALNPAPVPVDATLTRTLGWSLLNSSATASLMGKTVLEPATAISPDSSILPVSAGLAVGWASSFWPPLHDATTSSATPTRTPIPAGVRRIRDRSLLSR